MKRLILLVLLLAALVSAQSTTGAISGVITDPSAAAIPSVRVRATEVSTNVTTETVALAGGEYAFPALRPGTYTLEVEASGFSKLVRKGVEVRVNDKLHVDLQLTIGSTSENIVVSAAAPLVERESAALGVVMESRKIESLPLNTRNPFQLAILSPGVVPGGSFGNAFNNAANFIVNGNRGNTSDIMIDGITNSVPAANPIVVVAMFPSPDALQEFKVQTNGYPAEFGRSGGGIVNMVMKSGTNEFHGVVYEFLRNSKLDANDFFANRASRALGPFKRNQFGGVIGGPIIKNKAFFFFDYEGLRARSRNQLTATVPTELERQGDYSQSKQLVSGACVPVQIYDPSTTENVTGGFSRTPFANNIVPVNRQDAVGRRVASYFPQANQPGAACTGINNFLSDKSSASDSDQWDAKLDWYASTANRFSAGLSWRRYTDTPPNHYGNAADTRNAAGDNTPSRAMRVEYNRTQSPTLLFQARFGITRLERRFGPNVDNFSLTELGLPSSLVAQMSAPYNFPVFTFAGYTTLGRQSFLDQAGTSFTYAGSMTKITGRHTLKAGVEFRANQSAEAVGVDTNGNWGFDRAFTQGPDPNRPSVERGHAVASLLLGTPASGAASVMPRVLTSNPYAGIYVQDDFKLTRTLTLNFGLRWEVEPGRTERFDQLSYFDFNAANPLAGPTGISNLRGGLRFVGVDGNPGRQFDTDLNNLAPRFGFAWAATPKTVVRGGYGLFYLPFIGAAAGWASGVNGFLSSTQMVTTIDGVRPVDRLSNPFPSGLQVPTAPKSGLLTNIGQDFGSSGRDGAVDRSNRVGYSQQWNFNVQRELPQRVSFEMAYIGNKGVKLTDGPLGPQLNQLTVEQLQLGTQLQQSVANPFEKYVSTGSLSRSTTTRAQLLRPYPQFLSVYNFRPALASSIYHAMTIRVDKRFSNGLTLLASFTGGKMIDDASQTVGFLGAAPTHQNVYDLRADRSISAQDVSRRLVLSYVYDLPFGRGRSFGNGMPAWANLIAGNWQVNGIFTFSTGTPLSIANAQNNSNSFSATQRPNVSGDPVLASDRSLDDQLLKWFNTAVFSQPSPYTFGNTGRVLGSLRKDGLNNWDFSVFKNFPIKEQRRVELRGEFFNLTNTPEWAGPGQAYGNAQFGVVSSQANSPRQVQVALKIYF